MSEQTVTLVHAHHTLPVRAEPFYDGWGEARDGRLSLPADKVNWLRAAMMRGYHFTVDGRRLVTWPDLDQYIAESIDGITQTAESAGVTDESIDPRGFTTDTDRIRESESDSSEATPKRRTRSRKRSGTDD